MKKHLVTLMILFSVVLSSISFQANAGNIYDIATVCTWKFGRTDGTVLADNIKLIPTGQVTGYSNPNEYSWEIEDGSLIFRAQDSQVSTRFTYVGLSNTGQIVLKGAFLLDPSLKVTHSLTCHK